MNKLLIVVDYQVDFVTGSLGFEAAKELDGRIAAKIRKYRDDGGSVVFTFDTHDRHYPETQEGRNLPIVHCVEGTPGFELYGETGKSRLPDDLCFFKRTFGSIELADWLRKNPFDRIELCGLVADICVLSNAVIAKAACPEAVITVDASCTASADPSKCAAALEALRGVQAEIV